MSKQADLAKIHIAKKQLGLDDDAYRTILLTQAGQSSAADLDYAGRFKVLEYFKNVCHVKFKQKKNSATKATNWRKPRIKKIYALWFLLYDAGEVNRKTEQSIEVWCSKITGKKTLQWTTSANLNQCVESLKQWCNRAGVKHD